MPPVSSGRRLRAASRAGCAVHPSRHGAWRGCRTGVSTIFQKIRLSPFSIFHENNSTASARTTGGILIAGSNVLIVDCVISNNMGASGGNVRTVGFSPTLWDCEIIAGYDSSVQILNSSALIEGCRFHHTSSPFRSVVILSTNVTLRSSLFHANTTSDKSAALTITGGRVENCTLAANLYTATGNPGAGGIIASNTMVINSVIYSNKVNSYSAGNRQHDLILLGGSVVSNTCSGDLTHGVNGNITSDPKFLANATGHGITASGGDFRLNPVESPCIGTGVLQGWMALAMDLVGTARQSWDGKVDRGAYQFPTYPPRGTVIAIQ